MTVQQMLVDALLLSEKHDGIRGKRKRGVRQPTGMHFDAPTFVYEWFRRRGSAYFFLFKKNLRVTNLQFAELLALVRRFVKASDTDDIRDLQFTAVDDFNQTVTEIVESFDRSPGDPRARYREIAKLYTALFRRTCVVTNFFGSCAIFLPPGLKLDLALVCGLSGYIHSCGRSVYIRSAYKSTTKEFFKSLNEHLERFRGKETLLFFAPYSHEDFTFYDRDRATELHHGRDDVKIFIEKYYMGSEPMVTVLKNMRARFKRQLVIPEPGDYREMHPKVRSASGVDQHRTLWLILDHEIRPSLKHPEDRPHFSPSEKVYFICYDQMYVNENPFHLFDENKPAWVSHTTIPHTLAGAMLNITMPWWPTRTRVLLGDPFVGTGTTWLETLKYPKISFFGGDASVIAPMLAQDNLYFFCLKHLELLKLIERLKNLKKLPRRGPGRSRVAATPAQAIYTWAEKLFRKIIKTSPLADSFVFAPSDIRQLKRGRGPEDRLFFYVVLRTYIRHSTAFQRGSEDWDDAYLAELDSLKQQLMDLAELRKRESFGIVNPAKPTVLQAQYSLGCSLSVSLLRKSRGALDAVPIYVRNARSLPKPKFDVIITDPPYGFNTEGKPEVLARLYSRAIRVMIQALKEEGQLVIALPDWSHTGRQVPFFAHKEFVTQQVLVAAEELGREVFSAAYMAPSPGSMFKPPFYWESDRALRRAVLHFRIRKCP
jgi:tRNA G10  N-methylase Trm11